MKDDDVGIQREKNKFGKVKCILISLDQTFKVKILFQHKSFKMHVYKEKSPSRNDSDMTKNNEPSFKFCQGKNGSSKLVNRATFLPAATFAEILLV